MSNFIDASIKAIYNDTINKLNQDIGRNVVVIGPPTTISCPNCGWDPVKQISNNKYEPDNPYPSGVAGPTDFVTAGIRYCPVCSGKGKIITASNRRNVRCLISALTVEDAEKTPLGKNYKRNYELNTGIDAENYFLQAKSVIIDGHACEVVSVIPTGIGDLTQVTIYAGG